MNHLSLSLNHKLENHLFIYCYTLTFHNSYKQLDTYTQPDVISSFPKILLDTISF